MAMLAQSRTDAALLASYIAMVVGSLTAVSIAPPAAGAMLLVPIRGDVRAVSLAVARGAKIIGAGPGATTIVRGNRARLFWPLLGAGVLTLAAPSALCGDAAA